MDGDDNDKERGRTIAGHLMADDFVAAPLYDTDGTTGNAAKTTSGKSYDDDKDHLLASPGKSVDESDKKSSDDTIQTTIDEDQDDPATACNDGGDYALPVTIVSSSKNATPPYKYDPSKITLRFLFANRDGLTVTIEFKPNDTVGEVKGALLSIWPEDLPSCVGAETLRLVCMGKGFLMPDTRTLEDCQIPVFKTHPTPINVMVNPNLAGMEDKAASTLKSGGASSSEALTVMTGADIATQQASQGCTCTIL